MFCLLIIEKNLCLICYFFQHLLGLGPADRNFSTVRAVATYKINSVADKSQCRTVQKEVTTIDLYESNNTNTNLRLPC